MDGRRIVDLGEARECRRRDAGPSLVEVLVAIMLTGTLAVAGMVTLRASITGSTLGRDHANAHAWLQTASDVLYGAPRTDCGTEAATDAAAVADAYEVVIRGTPNPRGWDPSLIKVVRPVQFWDGKSSYQGICYSSGVNLQLVTIEVRGPDGRVVESVQIVKG